MSKRQAERLNRLRREKRGVVLLIVVSILTLFLMIGVTYVLVAGNYNKAAGQALRARTYGDESEREIEEVLAQVLYGTTNFPGTNVVVGNGVRSVIGPHSLLGDLYGNDWIAGTVAAAPSNYPPNNGQIMYFTVNLPSVQSIPNYYAGRVITFTDGPAAGISSRVMAYFPAGVNGTGTPELMVETPESDLPIPVAPSMGSRFIINGAPFNGTGAGFTKWTPGADLQWGNAGMDDDGDGVTDNRSEEGFAGSDDVLVNNLEEAVTLNYTGTPNRYPLAFLPNIFNLPSGSPNPAFGGFDETWDAPDYQNPFLAMVPPLKMSQFDGVPLLPSFHRPDLVQYWINKLSSTLLSGSANPRAAFLNPYSDPNLSPAQVQEIIALKRMILFRPLLEDHPNFTGGNQNFVADSLQGPYDVDNDGDGITDSVWVDAGLPPVTAPNGRRYKRLVAILIKDLDGRVNPSVHGNMQLATDANARPMTPITDTVAGTNPNTQPIYVPRGLGFGPAEVDFQHLFNNVFPLPPAGDNTVYSNILQQRYVGPTGGVGLPGYPNYDDGYPQVFPLPTTNKNDRTLGMPDIHPITQQVVSNYATPPDVWGRAALAVDYTGQPLWFPPNMATIGERLDDPYELQWNQAQATWDSPYTVSELEALLRYHDQGASILPSRLMLYAGYGNPAGNYLATESRGTPGASQRLRECFGMGSYIPAPRMIVPHELRPALTGVTSATILDLYYLAIVNGRSWQLNIGSNPADPNYATFIDQMRAEVPFELLKGQMFNINREFGNGQNDASNPALGNDPYGVVDDPSEIGAEQIQTTGGPANFDYLNDSDTSTPITLNPNPPGVSDPRQMMARHIYCLLMLLRNRAGIAGYDLDGDGNVTQAETARHLAQWAVNVVDFRDPDSIMTGFKYVNDPFGPNGWNINANLADTSDILPGVSGVVWGVERPELLITETITGHDRRTTDETDDQYMGMNNGSTGPPKEKDPTNDFDQYLLPHGWAFIELYNPSYDRGINGNANYFDHKPAELYTTSANGVAGVDLSRLSPNGNSPVWRMLIVRQKLPGGQFTYEVSGPNSADPDSPQPEALTEGVGGNPPPANYVDRTLYFADLSGGANYPSGPQYGEVYFPSSGIPRAPVLPGRYAVVGSSGAIQDAIPGVPYVTPIGRLNNGMAAGGVDPVGQDYAETRRIVLNPNVNPDNSSVQVIDNLNGNNPDVDVTTILPAVALPVDSMIPRGGGVPAAHSFNISEPIGGYAPYFGPSTYTPPGAGTEGNMTPHPVDQPFDVQRNAATSPGDDFQTYGLGSNDMTMPNYRTIHLQRLANPLLAWNAQTNPYITVDTSSMDLTVYNGVKNGDPSVTKRSQNFQTFQRGGRYYPGDPEAVGGYSPIPARPYRDLWSKEPSAVAVFQNPSSDSPQEPAGPHYFTRALYHTLGYLNKRYHSSGPQPYFGAAAPGNYRGSPYYQDSITGYQSLPSFPWLAFNNRPFNNPYELLQVPCQSSSQYLDKFNVQPTGQPTLIDPAPPGSPQPWYGMYQPPNFKAPSYPYSHLLNFYHTDMIGNTASEVSRLFDFVETRTPFIQTEKYYNPTQFVSPNQAPSFFRPPFNYLSRFREPGRININTIFDEGVWNAAVRGSPAMCTFGTNTNEGDGGQFLLRLALNRQGWGAGAGDLLSIPNYNAAYPSFFSNPFRTADSADMMPSIPVNLRHPPAEGGLLRRDPLLPTLPPPSLNPPPASPPFPSYPTTNGNEPLFASESVVPSQDAARNPYFRFQPLQKVGNLFSTNSNCYAVWITVGYFEVEQNPSSNAEPGGIGPGHPDGLRLAQEVGADEGNVKRHRAFFIIDRSIPVGYEPGHRHNTDKAVLLKRFIE
jgi:hypothetical protein